MDYVKELRELVGHRPLILPGSVVIISDSDNKILLQQRYDGSWGLPGGLMEPGESFEETARRQVMEETSLELGDLTLIDIVSGSEYYLKLKNGDELYSITAIFSATQTIGSMSTDNDDNDETFDIQYFSVDKLPTNMFNAYKKHIKIYLEEKEKKDEQKRNLWMDDV